MKQMRTRNLQIDGNAEALPGSVPSTLALLSGALLLSSP